jgi:hypothetical protein
MRGRSLALGATLLVALLAAPSARAQSPLQREALTRLRDSLSFARDTIALRALEAREIAVARTHRDDPIVHLRLGLIALRLADQLGGRHWDDAYSEFEWAAELAPSWPWPWFGIGLTASSAPDRAEGFAGGLYAMIGADRHRIAGTAFAKAVALDPSFTDGMVEFAITARDARIDAPLAGALAALRVGMVSPVSWTGELLLERGRIERLAGSPDSAVLAFRRALQVGFRPSMAWLELARTLPLLPGDNTARPRGAERESSAAYFAGAGGDDAEVVSMYRRDLEPIVDDTVLTAFDTLPGPARVEWLRAFWRDRDGLDLRPDGARLGEHYRRWQLALQQFRLPPFRRRYRYGVEIFRSSDGELDDRGIVYLRQGEPARRIVWAPDRRRNTTDALERTYGSETWLYRRPDGDLVLHFLAREDQADFRAVPSIFDLDVAQTELEVRSREVPGLTRLLFAGEYTRDMLRQEEQLRSRRSLAIATQSDSWERQYDVALPGRVQWYAIGSREGRPLVHMVYAVDAAALRAQPGTGLVPVTLRGGFFTRTGQVVASLDTVQLVRRPGPGVLQVALRAEVVVPPGDHKVRVGVQLSPRTGSIFPGDSLRVPSVRGDTLELSALLIGQAAHGLSWAVTEADTAWLDPVPVYAPDDTVTVYAEAYGARPDVEYQVRVTVTRQRGGLAKLLGGGRDAIALSERTRLDGERGKLRRGLALGGLDPGNYILELVVEGAGTKTSRRRGLTIRE